MQTLNIRLERIARGREWTIDFVARQVGITKQSMHQLETGRNYPSYEVLRKLEDLFQKDHRWLFTATTDTPPISQDE